MSARALPHGHGLTPAGKKVFDKQMPNTEPKLRQVVDKLREKFGTVLIVVDQPASIGAQPLTAARDTGCKVAYLPGLGMRRLADLPRRDEIRRPRRARDRRCGPHHAAHPRPATDRSRHSLWCGCGLDAG
jgi:hypothetical protein